jgi:antitoxin ParD1/3/4
MMPTRNVNLTDHYDLLVESLINSGKYKNASEVMRAGLRMLEREEKEDQEKLRLLRRLAAEAFSALDGGAGMEFEGEQGLADFIAELGRRAGTRRSSRREAR